MPCSISSMSSDMTCDGCRLFGLRLRGFFVLCDNIGVHVSIFCVNSFKISANSKTLLRGAIGRNSGVLHVEPSGDMVSCSCSCGTVPLPPAHPCIYQTLNGGNEERCLIVRVESRSTLWCGRLFLLWGNERHCSTDRMFGTGDEGKMLAHNMQYLDYFEWSYQ